MNFSEKFRTFIKGKVLRHIENDGHRYILIRRHGILLTLVILKYILMLLPIGLIIWIIFSYGFSIPSAFIHYVLMPTLLLSINYIFLQMILSAIDYYGKIMLISSNHIIIIHSSFILIDDIEFIDINSILKINVERHGLLSNILNYGNIIIEQRNDVRKIHYLPYPYEVYDTINKYIPLIRTRKV